MRSHVDADNRPLVSIDAGIDSVANRPLLRPQNDNYLCVIRSKPKDY